jgi:hypothetical protein
LQERRKTARGGKTMKTQKVRVVAKLGAIEVKRHFDYDEPETLEEAVDMDGDSKVMSLYLTERKTTFQNKQRRKMLSAITKKIAEAPPEKLQELGLDIE